MVFNSNQFLIEFETYDDDTAGIITERFATGVGYKTKISETPSAAVYRPLVKNTGSIDEYLFGNGRTVGVVTASAGRVVLNNADRNLDYLVDRGVDGRPITIRERVGDNYPADFPVRFSGVIEAIGFTDLTVELDIKSSFFNVKIETYQPIKYAGTNNGSSIYLEGTDEDVGGAPKPKLKGDGSNANIPVVLVDRPNEIYQVSSDPVFAIQNAYVGRADITAGTQHTTLASFVTAATTGGVAAGTFDSYLGDYEQAEGANERGCYVAFGTTPSKQVTVNAQEGWQNDFLYSEDAANAAWTKIGSSAGASSTKLEGALTVHAVTEDTSTGNHGISQDVSVTSGRKYTVSAIVEANGRDNIRLQFDATDFSGNSFTDFDLTTGTFADGADADGAIEDLGSGLYRIASTASATATATATMSMLFDNGGLSYTGDGASGMLMGGFQCEEYPEVSSYIKTVASAALNSAAPHIMWRSMRERGYTLDTASIIIANAANIDIKTVGEMPCTYWTGTRESTLGNLIELLSESVKAAITDDAGQILRVKIFDVPTVGEVELTVNEKTLLGSAGQKIRILRNRDTENGVPISRSLIEYNKNYLEMSEADVFGVAELTDIPFVTKEFRVATVEDAAVVTKYLTAKEREVETALVDSGDAAARAQYEMDLYSSNRLFVQIRLPSSIAIDLVRNDVVNLEGRIYRIIGRKLDFPDVPTANKVTTAAVTLQAWGGIKV